MTTDRCPSCGILYTQHYGLNMTCKDLMEARTEVERLKKNQANRQQTYELLSRAETAEAKLHEYLKYNYGKEDCLGCQERDAEVERLKELATDCEALRLMTADLAHYKAALAESCDNMRAEGPYEGMGICPQLQEVTAERDYYKSTLQILARGKSIESLIAREALEMP